MGTERILKVSPSLIASAMALITFSCSVLIPSARVSVSPTPTHAIGAVEATPSGPGVRHWSGTIQTTTNGNYATGGACTNEKWNSAFSLAVASDGSVDGSGAANIAAVPQCAGPGMEGTKTSATVADFSVSGTYDGSTFNLTFNETSIDGTTAGLFNYALLLGGQLHVPATGPDRAGATITVSNPVTGGVATANAQHIIDMTCQDCK